MKQFHLKEEYIGRPLEKIAETFRFPTIIEDIHAVFTSGEIVINQMKV